MQISPEGIRAIRDREGFRTHAYRDSRGIWTIGVGHTGPEVHEGLVWSEAEVDEVLGEDLKRFVDCVNSCVRRPLTKDQFDACVSLAFNIGCHGFAGSSVVKMINMNRIRTAADDFLMWERPPELKKRREGERAQFLKGMAQW